MPAYGFSAAGWVTKPTSAILADLQQAVWATIDSELDLSPQTPDGQMLAIVANELGAAWELIGIAANQYNREDVEGAGLDNLGDIIGVPRESESYTQIYAVCALTTGGAPYLPGTLVANIAGSPSLTYTNLASVTASQITAASGNPTVLFQSTVIGATAAPATGTLTTITTPVTGWSAITNPAPGYSQLGSNEELDSAYGPRQESELAAEGSCTPNATAAAVQALGAAQQPPVTLLVFVVENTTNATATINGLSLAAHTYCVVIYDQGSGWASDTTPGVNGLSPVQMIGNTIYANKPAGITSAGTTSVSVDDPILGPQEVFYSVPTPEPLFVSAVIVPRPGAVFATLQAEVQNALIAAAVAPTLASGIPPTGQLAPGSYVVGGQLEAVIMSVPGVFDVYGPSGGAGSPVQFALTSSPVNTLPLAMTATQVATITLANVGNLVITAGAYPG